MILSSGPARILRVPSRRTPKVRP